MQAAPRIALGYLASCAFLCIAATLAFGASIAISGGLSLIDILLRVSPGILIGVTPVALCLIFLAEFKQVSRPLWFAAGGALCTFLAPLVGNLLLSPSPWVGAASMPLHFNGIAITAGAIAGLIFWLVVKRRIWLTETSKAETSQ